MSSSHSLHLLLAEDNAEELFFIKRALESAGYGGGLETVADGVQAIERLSAAPGRAPAAPLPDALILDLSMPRKSGFDVLQWLRERELHLPVIVHTSTDDPREAERALALGAHAFVVKEVSYRALIRKLGEML